MRRSYLLFSGCLIALAGLWLSMPASQSFAQPTDPVERVRLAAARSTSSNNLKQMALALHNFDAVNGFMPAAAHCDASGKPLLSWRVLILPYIEEPQLYAAFRFDEPWDSPHNKQLLQYMPKVYALPTVTKTGDTKTYYRAFASDPRVQTRNGQRLDAGLDLFRGVRFAQFPDGTSNTILLAEAADAVEWTKPDELMFDVNSNTLPRLGNHYTDGARVAYADGSVRVLRPNLQPTVLRGLITRNGAEVVQP